MFVAMWLLDYGNGTTSMTDFVVLHHFIILKKVTDNIVRGRYKDDARHLQYTHQGSRQHPCKG